MKIYGIDFTSSPSRKKPITCLECDFDGGTLTARTLLEWTSFDGFEAQLENPGPWIAGIDFPFGQARRFIETIGWPTSWDGYVRHARSLGKQGFVDALNDYRVDRAAGDKEHRRETDKRASSISPQKLYGVPVGKMFFEGAPRLIQAGVTVPGLQVGDPDRIVVEAYPGVLARYLIGKTSYKNDTKAKQTVALHEARLQILQAIDSGRLENDYGVSVTASIDLASDPTGDSLDALLCAIQAAWAWTKRGEKFGEEEGVDPLEGWIADPLPPTKIA
ncbi:MAG: DUF429 domain-containing protein [Halioglobus sp.]